jgi:hypothetical protein
MPAARRARLAERGERAGVTPPGGAAAWCRVDAQHIAGAAAVAPTQQAERRARQRDDRAGQAVAALADGSCTRIGAAVRDRQLREERRRTSSGGSSVSAGERRPRQQ